MYKISHIALGLASVMLSASVWALGFNEMTDPWNDFWGDKNDPEYMLVDKDTHQVRYLEGLEKGKVICDKDCLNSCERPQYQSYMGDEITDLKTKRSGIITGVHEEGTMEVMKPNGKTVRYKYVTFKVKPVK